MCLNNAGVVHDVSVCGAHLGHWDPKMFCFTCDKTLAHFIESVLNKIAETD